MRFLGGAREPISVDPLETLPASRSPHRGIRAKISIALALRGATSVAGPRSIGPSTTDPSTESSRGLLRSWREARRLSFRSKLPKSFRPHRPPLKGDKPKVEPKLSGLQRGSVNPGVDMRARTILDVHPYLRRIRAGGYVPGKSKPSIDFDEFPDEPAASATQLLFLQCGKWRVPK
ncbi:hypothetical protein KM043_006074 [Ampulex compressa]|nr:hypothetical protein KM043_006074 [Ampulex compressa]